MVGRRQKLLGFLGLLALVACGDGGGGLAAGEGRGGLLVQVKKATGADVESMWIELQLNPQPGEYTGNPVVRFPLVEQGGTWSALEENIYVGTYVATVYAFDRPVGEQAFASDQGGIRGEALFLSNARSLKIDQNEKRALVFLLHEQTAPGSLQMPRFVAVQFDRAVVEQWEELHITVEAEHGSGTLEKLSGRFHPGQTPGTGIDGAGLFVGDGDFAGGTIAELTWVPPLDQGPKRFLLRIEDDAGQVAELGLEVLVGLNFGSLEINIEFNEAPVLAINELRVVNGASGTEVHVWADFEDAENHNVTYQWSDDCGPEFVWTQGGSGLVATPSQRVYATLVDDTRIQDDRDRDPDASCTVTLEAVDEKGAVRRLDIEILTGWLEPLLP